ncbi:MAG: threonylcarbamoyl-AMP synthase [Candidatus Tectomicrobia bacterium]|uniref:L-threonylcarbamoyladenylate synthase n=1 Tax=Tectimicrobiota bacterium TaxID=2528274 RepID=A0A932M1Y5_UNCTE|nr:threonylcarbamoyl-AMP synthase [Candidatus Tectomicrobia bacterium]
MSSLRRAGQPLKRISLDLSSPNPALLEEAAQCARRGGVVIYPTDTLYGLGCAGSERAAVERVMALKGRSAEKSFPLLIADETWLAGLVGEVPESALVLQRAFWPGPLTLIYRASTGAPAHLVSHAGTIGLRISRSPVAQGLVRQLGVPLVATSANRSGEPCPGDVDSILRSLGEGADLYLDGGELPPSRGSTVVDVSAKDPLLLREGDLPWRVIRALLNEVGE